MRRRAPFGSWESPFPIELLTAGRVSLADVRIDRGAREGSITWLEGRPQDAGRTTLVRLTADGPRDISPAGMNVRDRVHEYGGAPYLVHGDLVIVSDFATGRLHRVGADRSSAPITPEGRFRYADYELDVARDRIIAVREDHSGSGEAENTIVAIPLDGSGDVTILARGHDFFAAPRLSPDGRRLAWLSWDHPNLPWDGTELHVAGVTADGGIGEGRIIAGSPSDWTSQPRWQPDGSLVFVAEPGGWMNLYRWDGASVSPLTALDAEFAFPDWVFGFRTHGATGDGTIYAIGRAEVRDRLYRIVPGGQPEPIELPFTDLSWIDVAGDGAVFVADSPTTYQEIVELDLATGAERVLRRSTTNAIDPADVSLGEHVEFPTAGGDIAHGIFYRPHNREFEGPDRELPPLIVTSHGGPTAGTSAGLSISRQLLTSRGFAVLDVDYRGSSGYGRDYRRALEGQWGIADVDDCVFGAQHLVQRGLVDGDRLAIEGGSASGYTTLAALAFRDVFDAGVSYFGIGNLEAFVRETHKFESRYLERLIGPWPAAKAIYDERSPILHTERIHCPVLILQGLDDHIVPPSEAERIVDALSERRIPHAYLAFEGEDHGFRKAENISRSFEAELSFYGQIFGFEPADPIEPLRLEHFDAELAGGAVRTG